MLHGTDCSAYQPSWTPPKGDSFVIIKTTESTGYVNPYAQAQAARARAAGFVVGFYHFFHPDNAQAQADFFVANSPIEDGDLLVCDWEVVNGVGQASSGQKDNFLAAVKAHRPNHMVGLYCNTSSWKTLEKSNNCGDFLWIATYGVSDPGISHAWKFWQYTSSPIDQNHGNFSNLKALKKWAGSLGGSTPAKPSQPAPQPILSTPTPKPVAKPEPKKPTPAAPEKTVDREEVVARVQLHGRKTPDLNDDVAKTLPVGSLLVIENEATVDGTKWIQGNGGLWWVANNTIPVDKVGGTWVADDRLHGRAIPDATSEVVKTVVKGTEITMDSKTEVNKVEWLHANGGDWWLASNLTKKK